MIEKLIREAETAEKAANAGNFPGENLSEVHSLNRAADELKSLAYELSAAAVDRSRLQELERGWKKICEYLDCEPYEDAPQILFWRFEAAGELGEAVKNLAAWAKTEQEHWCGRNADRYWQMNRVIGEIAKLPAALAACPKPVTDAK